MTIDWRHRAWLIAGITEPLRAFSRFQRQLMLALLLAPIAIASVQPFPVPVFDSIGFLDFARTLVATGTYAGSPAGPRADGQPGREPLYSVLIAGVAAVSPRLKVAVTTCPVTSSRPSSPSPSPSGWRRPSTGPPD